MKCDTVRDDLAVVALGDDQPLAPHLLEHLAECAACRQAYRDYLAAGEALIASVPEVAPPPDLRARILAQVAAAAAAPGAREGREAPAAPAGRSAASPGAAAPQRAGDRAAPGRRAKGTGAVPAWTYAAAVALLALSTGLGLRAAQLEREVLRLREVERVTLTELGETLRAFSGEPAAFAGRLEFASAREGVAAEGIVYQRPNGWAVLMSVSGIPDEEAAGYRVWVREDDAWRDAGSLVAAGDGARALVYYSRSGQMPHGVRVVPGGILPGEPGWAEEALVTGGLADGGDAPRDGGGEPPVSGANGAIDWW